VSGRKRHILVDTMGNLLKIKVHPANISESAGGVLLLTGSTSTFPRLSHLWVDQGYKPTFVAWVQETLRWTVTVLTPPYRPRGDTAKAIPELIGDTAFEQRYAKGFRLLPRRWVVERTLAWFGKQRRLSKDYELLSRTEETWAYLTMSRLMLRRLAQPKT
jgi:putative transposase